MRRGVAPGVARWLAGLAALVGLAAAAAAKASDTADRSAERDALAAIDAGRFERGIFLLEGVLAEARAGGDAAAYGRALVNLGYGLHKAGRHDQAYARYLAGAQELERAGEARSLISALVNAATVEATWLGRPEAARATLARACATADRAGFAHEEGTCRLNLAESLFAGGDLATAAAAAERALAIFRRLGDALWTVRTLLTAAKLDQQAGRFEQAEALARQATAAAERQGASHELMLAHNARARALEGLGRLHEAVAAFETEAELLEAARRRAGGDAAQIDYLRGRRDSYEPVLTLRHRLHLAEPGAGHHRAAWAALEASRSRPLLEALPPAPAVDPPTLDGPRIAYFFGDRRVYGFALSTEGLRFLDLGPSEDLADRVAFLVRRLLVRGDDWQASAIRLRAELLTPLLGDRTPDRLTIIADGTLHGLPFAALFVGDRSSGAEPAIAYAPSSAVLDRLAARSAIAPRTAACDLLSIAVGDGDQGLPPLPRAEREARWVGRLAASGRARVLVEDATEARVRQALAGRCRAVHLAAHALVEADDPGSSRIVLASGELTADEVAALDLPAELVVLAACRTGGGEVLATEGVLGLGRAFLRAGARALLVTLWPVSDAVAERMTRCFYTRVADGEPFARALAHARASCVPAADGYAFVLVGDGGGRLAGLRSTDRRRRGTGWALLAAGAVMAALALALGRRRTLRADRAPPAGS